VVQVDRSKAAACRRVDIDHLEIFADWTRFQRFPSHFERRFVDLQKIGTLAEQWIESENSQLTRDWSRYWRILCILQEFRIARTRLRRSRGEEGP
jgi:hypothetical protein